MKWISAQTSSTVKGFLMFIFYFNGVFWKKYKYFKVKWHFWLVQAHTQTWNLPKDIPSLYIKAQISCPSYFVCGAGQWDITVNVTLLKSDRYMVTASSKEINVVFVFSSSNCVFNRIQNRSITKTLCAGSSDF